MNTAAPPSLANGRIRQAPSHRVIMSSLDPPQSLPRRARQHRSHSPTRLPRPAYSLRPPCQGIKVAGRRSIEALDNRPRPAIYRRFGVIRRRRAAIMSALQQSPICGLEEPEIPLSRRGPPGTSRRGTRPAKPVASYRGSSPWRLARSWGFCARGCLQDSASPVIILALIAVPSFRLLFVQTQVPTPGLTVKVTGKQWFWSYSYPDNGNFEFDSLMVQDKDLKPGQPRLLAVDNEMVVPINKVVHVLVTGADVIHSFAVPSFGIRIDAIPGRL